MPKPLNLKGTIRVNAPLRGGMMASRVFGHGGLPVYVAVVQGAQQQTVTEAQSWELTVGRYHTSNLDRIPHSGR